MNVIPVEIDVLQRMGTLIEELLDSWDAVILVEDTVRRGIH